MAHAIWGTRGEINTPVLRLLDVILMKANVRVNRPTMNTVILRMEYSQLSRRQNQDSTRSFGFFCFMGNGIWWQIGNVVFTDSLFAANAISNWRLFG
jgi:hypothetical protein